MTPDVTSPVLFRHSDSVISPGLTGQFQRLTSRERRLS